MKHYTIDDLHVITDTVAVIRRRPLMYAGEKPWGQRFASRLMDDLILHGVPAHLETIEGWWIILTGKDWLAPDGAISTKPFFHITAFPAAGVNSMRTEVLLTAFADAVVIWGEEGCIWIRGDADHWHLPDRLKAQGANIGQRRLVACKIDDES
jgi:hypothetical protein